MPNDRIDAALTLIEAVAGTEDRTRTEAALRPMNLAQIDSSLSIGGFRGPFKSEPETFRRTMVRAVVLTRISKGLPVAQAAQQITSLTGKTTAQLQNELLQQFPYKAYRGNFEKRQTWAPSFFTNPTKHSMSQYTYVVHALQRDPSKVAEYNLNNASELEILNKLQTKYAGFAKLDTRNPVKHNLNVDFLAQYLDNPDIIQNNIISSSVISEKKHATYYPIGFIMEVPPECIYITSPSDVSVANRTTDIIAEFQRAGSKTANSIRPPQEILAETSGVGGELGYNEIVIVGTSPEQKKVKVVGLYVKVDGQDNLYAYKGTATNAKIASYIDEPTRKLLADCSKKHNLPIVPIRDTTSELTNQPWPFAPTEELALRQQLASATRARTHTI